MEIKFKNFELMNGIKSKDLILESEKISCIVGKNSSGKTTFINTLYGLNSAFKGDISIGRQIINYKTDIKKIRNLRKKISYLKQDYFDDLVCKTVTKYLELNSDYLKNDKLKNLLSRFGLNEEILYKSSLELTDSEIKKVLLIKIFINNSKIILLDDPTIGLDSKSISTLIKLLKEEKRKGKTIVVSSTDSEFLLSIADSIIIIDDNKIYKEMNKYNFFCNKNLLNRLNLKVPNVIDFKLIAGQRKKIKLLYRDNINDLLKEIYRNVK